jgi:hypothetical protein
MAIISLTVTGSASRTFPIKPETKWPPNTTNTRQYLRYGHKLADGRLSFQNILQQDRKKMAAKHAKHDKHETICQV